VRILFDHSISPVLSDIIAALEAKQGTNTVEHLRQFYPGEAKDADWLPGVAQVDPGFVVITADPKIAKSAAERAAWLESGLTIFFLKSFADLPIIDQAWRLIKMWPEILKKAVKAKKGNGFMVSIHGKVEPAE
jgi:hypothetical protein